MADAMSSVRLPSSRANGVFSSRQTRIHTLIACLFHGLAPAVKAMPLVQGAIHALEEDLPKDPEDASLWIYLSTAMVLVLLGGAFAGLTIAYVRERVPPMGALWMSFR
jgi:metal transporter CNNM